MTFNVRPRGTSRLDLFEGYGRLSASMGYQALYVTLFGNRFDIFSVSIPLDRSVVKLHAYAYNLEYHTAQRIAVEFYSLLTSVPVPRGAMQNYRHPVIHYIDHETREPWYAKALTFLESLMPL